MTEPPCKKIKLDSPAFHTVKEIMNKRDEVTQFLATYKTAMKETCSKFIYKRVSQKIDKANEIIERINSNGVQLTVGLCGPTASGKSYIANCIISYGTNHFNKNTITNYLLPSGGFKEKSDHGGVTFLPSKIVYGEQCKLERIIRPRFKTLEEESRTKVQQTNIPALEEEEEDDLGEKTDEDVSTKQEVENLCSRNSVDKSFITEVRTSLKGAKFQDTLGFNIMGPFPYLKEYGIVLKDIPGLSDSDPDVAIEASSAATDLDVVILVAYCKRGMQEFSHLNLIEELIDRKKSELPFLIALNNELTEEYAEGITDKLLKENLSNVFLNLADERYFGNILGARREEVFKEMKDRCYGLSFTGFNSASDNDTADRVQQTLARLGSYLDEIRKQKIHTLLEEALYYILSSAYEIRKDLNTVSKFKKENRVNCRSTLQTIMNKHKTKKKGESWSKTVHQVLDELDDYIRPVTHNNESNSKITLDRMIPSSFYAAFIEKVLNEHFEITRQLLVSFVVTAIPAIKEDDLEIVDSPSRYEPMSEKIERLIAASKQLRSDYQKRGNKEENETSLQIQLGKKLYETVKLCLEDCRDILIEAFRTKVIFDDIKIAIYRNLPKDIFEKGHRYDKEFICNFLRSNFDRLWLMRKWKHKDLMRKGLFTNTCMLEKFEEIQNAFERASLLENDDNANVNNLKKKITCWFNNVPQPEKPQKMDSKDHPKLKWEEYNPEDGVNHEVNVEKENRRTQAAKKMSERQAKDFADTRMPKGLVRKEFRNFIVEVKKAITLQEVVEKGNVKKIRIEHKKIDQENTGFSISYYTNMFEDLTTLLQSDKCIFPICIPSYGRREHFAKSALIARREEEMEDFPHLIYLFIEEGEFETYFSRLSEFSKLNDKLIYVTIPGKGRGVAFARSMIKMWVDTVSQHCLSEYGTRFDWWWMIDDDVQMARVFEKTVKTQSMMRPCTVALALTSTQEMVLQRVNKFEDVLSDEDEGFVEEYGDVLFNTGFDANARRLGQIFGQKEKFVEFIRYVEKNDRVKVLNFLMKHKLVNGSLRTDSEEFQGWIKKLMEKANELLQSNSKVVHISIANSINNEIRTNYNLVANGKHYRASTQRHGCLLSHVPGLWGYNYLEWNQLLLSDDQVNQERQKHFNEEKDRKVRLKKISEHIVNSNSLEEAKKKGYYEYRDNFLGEDKKFVHLLLKDNRSGFQAFYFDIVWGGQRKGGCFKFRRSNDEKY